MLGDKRHLASQTLSNTLDRQQPEVLQSNAQSAILMSAANKNQEEHLKIAMLERQCPEWWSLVGDRHLSLCSFVQDGAPLGA